MLALLHFLLVFLRVADFFLAAAGFFFVDFLTVCFAAFFATFFVAFFAAGFFFGDFFTAFFLAVFFFAAFFFAERLPGLSKMESQFSE